MIGRLMRLSWDPLQAVSVFIVTPLIIAMGQRTNAGVLQLAPLLFIVTMMNQRDGRATPFEAGLPISSRELFLARLLRQLSLTWFPILVCIAVIAARHRAGGPSLWPLLEAGALCTLGILAPQMVRISELNAPRLPTLLAWTLVAAGGAVVCSMLPPMAALALFAATIVVVSLRTWSALPASFQLAPANAVRSAATGASSPVSHGRASAHAVETLRDIVPRTPLWSVFRSALSWGLSMGAFTMVVQAQDGFTFVLLCWGFAQFRFSLASDWS